MLRRLLPPSLFSLGAIQVNRPWHTSSRVVAVVVILFLAFCNVPGQYVDRLTLEINPFWQADYTPGYEHGWPLTFIERDQVLGSLNSFGGFSECWKLWQGGPRISWAALGFNMIVVVVLAIAGGALFELWRRRRRHLLQFHLLDALAALTLVSCLCAWYVAERRESAWEQAMIHAGPLRPYGVVQPTGDFGIEVKKWREGGVTWLRRGLGGPQCAFLDRAVSINAEATAMRRAARLSGVESLQLVGDVTNDDLAVLEQFPSLELIDFGHARVRDRSGQAAQVVQLPRAPALRGLNLENFWERPVFVRGLAHLRSLEYLNLLNYRLDEEGIRELGTLTRLRELKLNAVDVPEGGCSHLGELANLRRLTVSGGVQDEQSLRAIGRLIQLRELTIAGSMQRGSLRHLKELKQLEVLKLTSFYRVDFDDESLSSIGELSQLRQLIIPGCTIPRGSLSHLCDLRNLEVLELAGAEVALEDLGELKALRGLKILDLRGVPLRQAQYEMLVESLPYCEIR